MTDTAIVTVDYSAAPNAVNDTPLLVNLVGSNAVVNILANDLLSNGNPAAPTNTTVDLDPTTPGVQTTLVVAGQGTWTYNPTTGNLTFAPLATFTGDPTPITYTLTETATGLTDTAIVTVDYSVAPNAVNDTPLLVNPGETTISIFGNDTLLGNPVIVGGTNPNVVLTSVSTLPTGIVVNPNGTVTILPGTPADNYTFTYTICSVSTPSSCSTATVNITVNPYTANLEVFNGLTPNGDGLDDVFKILGIENYPNNSVEIFNRWGVLVYEAQGYNNQDRAFKGSSEGRVTVVQDDQLPEGTYFYILKYNKALNGSGDAKDQAGYLYINR